MSDIFLSYSREDQATARRFAEGLQREGFSVWWDQALNAGEEFDQVTEKALDQAKAVVVLWSKKSVDSRWVRAEATQAKAAHRLVPVMIEPCKRPIMFELTHTADLTGWNGNATDLRWSSFLDGLKKFVGGAEEPEASISSAPPVRRARTAWIAGGVLLIALLGVASWWLLHAKPRAAAQTAQPAIAVLPFDDMSPGKDQGYLADGLAEEILNSLARIPGVTVFARNSSFEYRTRGESLTEFGATLGATHLLEGSLRKSGEQLRITAQLINARTGAHLWSRTYDRPLQDVFKIQEEIAAEVAETLEISLGVGRTGSVPGYTRNVEAWDAFLSGNRSMGLGTAESALRAIDELTRAVTIDPSFAAGWARLSTAYGEAAGALPDPPDESWREKIDRAAREANRLAPDSAFVLVSDAARALRRRDWKEMDRLLTQASEVAAVQGAQGLTRPNRGTFLSLVGRFREAMAIYERERIRNPLDPNVAAQLGNQYAADGNLAAAMAEFDRGAAMGGPNRVGPLVNTTYLALVIGDRAEILRRLDMMAASPETAGPVNAAMRPLLDDRVKALAELRRLAADSPNPRTQAAVGLWAAYFGDPQLSLSILGPQALNGGALEIFRIWGPLMRDARRLPEFKQLVKDLGLVDYWRENGWGQPCQPITGTDDFECT